MIICSQLRNSKLLKLTSLYAVGRRTAVNLSFKIFGSRQEIEPHEPPIIILHGLLGSKKNWKSIGKTILRMTKRPVVTVDLRNHGASPHSNSQRYEEQAGDVLRLIQKLEVEKASLIGHDMGARTAMCTSLMKPSVVAGILLVDMSPVSTCVEFKEYYPKLMKAMMKVQWKEKKKVHKAVKAVKKQLKHIIKDEVIMKGVLSNINVKRNGTIGWICNLDVLMKQFKHLCTFPESLEDKRFHGPSLFIGGQTSECIPVKDLPGIREMFPHAVIKFVPGVGHNVHAEDTRSFLELAITFLRSY